MLLAFPVANAVVSPVEVRDGESVATGPRGRIAEAAAPVAAAPPDEGAAAPLDVERVALVGVAVVVVLFAIRVAKDFCIAVVVGVMISYALEPLVAWMARHRVPRSLGAALVLLTLVAGMASGVYILEDDAAAFLDTVPLTAQKLRDVLHRTTRPTAANAVGKVEQLANEIEKSAREAAAPALPPPGVTPIQIQEKPIDIRGYLWSSSLGLAALVAQATLLFFLAYFLLASLKQDRHRFQRSWSRCV